MQKGFEMQKQKEAPGTQSPLTAGNQFTKQDFPAERCGLFEPSPVIFAVSRGRMRSTLFWVSFTLCSRWVRSAKLCSRASTPCSSPPIQALDPGLVSHPAAAKAREYCARSNSLDTEAAGTAGKGTE